MRIVVGRLGRAHGVRGEVAVEVRTDDPELRFAPGSRLFTAEDGDHHLVVSRARWHSGRLLVAFDGVADRTAAERLRGCLLYRDAADEVVEDDAWYDYQLVGCAVLVGGAEMGTVTEVLHLPAQDCLAVELVGGEVRLVPLVAEIVLDVDPRSRRITVADLPGLLSDEPGE